jgi:hypothetical protein
MIAPTGELDVTRCWVLAEALYLYGVEREAAGSRPEADPAYLKARALYAALAPEAAFYGLDEATDRIDEIDARRARWSGDARDAS